MKTIKTLSFDKEKIISDDVEALNPIEAKLYKEGKIMAYGICPYCRKCMSAERWTIHSNGYECKNCGHKTFLLHSYPFTPCSCKNCKK